MAGSVPFYEALTDDIVRWTINSNQLNPDRGAMQDAAKIGLASAGVNAELTSGLMRTQSQLARDESRQQADLSLRNFREGSTATHNFQIDGMREANRLSQEYLRQEGREQRGLQETVNRGATDVAGIQRNTQLGVADRQVAAANYGADRSLDASALAAGASRFGAELGLQGVQAQVAGQNYQADRGVDSTRIASGANLQGVLAQADAARFSAAEQSGAERYGADRAVESTRLGADASRYGSDRAAEAQIGTAAFQFQGTREVADANRFSADRGAQAQERTATTQADAARDVAAISGNSSNYAQDQETRRFEGGLSSSERQIGLMGNEQRRTVETQGDQSRRSIVTEGEQSRENIRTTGDEQRRSLAFDRANAAKTAIANSRRA